MPPSSKSWRRSSVPLQHRLLLPPCSEDWTVRDKQAARPCKQPTMHTRSSRLCSDCFGCHLLEQLKQAGDCLVCAWYARVLLSSLACCVVGVG